MKSPNQELYDNIYIELDSAGVTPYDVLPMYNVDYPFVTVKSRATRHDKRHKRAYSLMSSYVIDCYALENDRLKNDELVNTVLNVLKHKIKGTSSIQYTLRELNTNEITDRSTNDTLLHTVITCRFELNTK